MELDIKAGKRVLYKENGQWHAGEIATGAATINEHGLYIPIITMDGELITSEINDMFLNSFKLESWVHEYPEYYMTKEQYIEFMRDEDFDYHQENAFVADNEYGYYPVAKYNKNWIEKQPFEYIIRSV